MHRIALLRHRTAKCILLTISAIAAIKSEKKTALTPHEIADASPVTEHGSNNAALQLNKRPKKVVKDGPKPRPAENSSIANPLVDKLESEVLEIDPNDSRRKRQKTISPQNQAPEQTEDVPPSTPTARRQKKASSSANIHVASAAVTPTKEATDTAREEQALESFNIHGQLGTRTPITVIIRSPRSSDLKQGADNGVDMDSDVAKRKSSAIVTQPAIINDTSEGTRATTDASVESKPKKILHFNPKTGTIGSPPLKKSIPTDNTKTRSNGRAKRPKSKLVTIRYGHDGVSTSAIGLKIDQILKGKKAISPMPKGKKASTSNSTEISSVDAHKNVTSTSAVPVTRPTALHPFFSGKSVVKPAKPEETANIDPAVVDLERQEPSTLRRVRAGSREKPPSPSKPRSSAFTGFTGYGASIKLLKFPGAMEPAWPWKGMVHICRDGDVKVGEQRPTRDTIQIQSKARKAKYQAIEILAEEDIIATFANGLDLNMELSSINEVNMDRYPQLSSCLRVPIKHFESGYDLQKRVKVEVQARLPISRTINAEESSEDEIQVHSSSPSTAHPAVLKAYTSIATSLTAFDQFRYETQSWTQKYSPKSAVEVLQTGREAVILKEWLQKLTVMSVETGSSDRPNSRASSVSRLSAPSKLDLSGKRKRKAKKLDGFIVSSDEEDRDMDEISEPEDGSPPRDSNSLLKKTVIRASKDTPRLGNAVVISGPHGCGKTAAVYAVAKELGFEVFEINSSSRRSGKDILERVGDMTRNHLVQHSHNQALVEVLDEDAQRVSDALADDIKSGRQGTMNSFFKTKDDSNPNPKPKKPKPTARSTEIAQASLVPKALPIKQKQKQKQSLILFEEVDVLYEEDKQFWVTVMNLVLQSKRPIIMTCKDESVIPTQALALHAILRFSPPPIDLATDYMLSVAANEGHALERNAVKSLYQSRSFDLRASLTELNFWCQFAIGDVKGGLDWICPRWPLGCDVDKHGNKIRVVSEKTYEAGMGWLSQDVRESHAHHLDIEEETLHEVWDGWRLDLGDWQKNIDVSSWATKVTALSTGRTHQHACLSIYEDFADAMSIADMCSGSAFAPDNHVGVPKLTFGRC